MLGVSGCPHIHMPHMFVCPIHSYTTRDADTPICPHTLLASVCSQRLLYVVGDCRGPLHVGHLPYMLDTSPVWGVSPHMSYTHHSLVGFPVHLYVLGISACAMRNIPLMLGVWGCSPIYWMFGGISTIGCPYASSCTFL